MREVNGVSINGIEAVKLANSKATNGNNWFSVKTMKYWGTRLNSALYGSRYFVTSDNNFDGAGRLYSIRELDDDGLINTVAFQPYTNYRQAHRAAKLIAAHTES